MTIEWKPSAGPTLGVEWEVQLVDAQTRMLRQEAATLLAALPGLSESGEHPKMRHELMQSTIEVVTGVCGTVAEAKADLAISLKDLQRVAEPHGIVLASSGVHAMTHWRDQKMAPSQRYAELVQEIQWPARRLQTMAVHVHVGLRDSGTGDAGDQRARRLPAAPARPLRVEPVLVRRGHRPRLDPLRGLRRAAAHRPAARPA